MSNIKLLVCGDSFTYGSEIVNPKFLLEPTVPNKEVQYNGKIKHDYDTKNDDYRLQRIWPTYLGEMLGVGEVINIAKPAVSNSWIKNTTIGWLLENYISQKKSTEELLLIVGWTNIVRREFFFNENDKAFEKTLNSYGDFNLENKELQNFFKDYLLSIHYEYEGVYDFINCNFELIEFCEKYKIKYRCFNSLPKEHHIKQEDTYYQDLNVNEYIDKFKSIRPLWGRNLQNECKIKWYMVNKSTFLLKDEKLNSFTNYIMKLPLQDRLFGIHPSPESHKVWADVLYGWIVNNTVEFKNIFQKLI